MSEKKKLTPEELSAVRSRAGRLGGLKGGRKKGSGNGRAPTKTLTAREPDYNILSAYANMRGIAIAEAVHLLCLGIAKKYPDLLNK